MNGIPCRDSGLDPDDWFIEKDGRQYPDEVLVPDEELENVAFEARALYVEGREDMIIRDRLKRRRHAKDACYQCPMRLECLTQALDEGHAYGIWGGYYPEELRKIRRAIAARESRRRQVVD